MNFCKATPNSYISSTYKECQFTGMKPEKTRCGCQGWNVYRRGIPRTCKLKNVQLRVPPDCNTVDILAVEKGATVFELEPAPFAPESVVVNNVPPLQDQPRVFPTRGNFAVGASYTPL